MEIITLLPIPGPECANLEEVKKLHHDLRDYINTPYTDNNHEFTSSCVAHLLGLNGISRYGNGTMGEIVVPENQIQTTAISH